MMDADRRSIQEDARAVERLQTIVGRVLRGGAFLSTGLMAVGLILALTGSAGSWSDIPLRIGLVILMATPVANVVVSGLEYVAERDWKFVLLTILVLVILSGSLAVALMQRG